MTKGPSARKRQILEASLVALVLVAAFAIRMLYLDERPFWVDEAESSINALTIIETALALLCPLRARNQLEFWSALAGSLLLELLSRHRYPWHCNGHTFASRLVMAGADLRSLQSCSGTGRSRWSCGAPISLPSTSVGSQPTGESGKPKGTPNRTPEVLR
jgi:hypothetical protein